MQASVEAARAAQADAGDRPEAPEPIPEAPEPVTEPLPTMRAASAARATPAPDAGPPAGAGRRRDPGGNGTAAAAPPEQVKPGRSGAPERRLAKQGAPATSGTQATPGGRLVKPGRTLPPYRLEKPRPEVLPRLVPNPDPPVLPARRADQDHTAVAGSGRTLARPPARVSNGEPTRLRQPPAPPAATARRGRLAARIAGAAAAVVLLVTGGAVAVMLASHGRAAPQSGGPGRTAPGQPATMASLAAAWVARQVSHDAIVSCDQPMCSALAAAGFPGGHLQLITPTSPYPRHSDVVVVTPAVLGQFGSSLATEWAPEVLARFGSGGAAVTVRMIVRQGAAAYQSALTADLKLRSIAGAGLLASRQITASAAARKQLLTGQVDARLIIVLTALASVQPVHIVGFGTVFAGTSPGLPLRIADLAETDRAAQMARSDYLKFLLTVVHAQPAVYRPETASLVPSTGGRSVFRIQYAAPSPVGLLGPQAP